jgi:hypothetical protein
MKSKVKKTNDKVSWNLLINGKIYRVLCTSHNKTELAIFCPTSIHGETFNFLVSLTGNDAGELWEVSKDNQEYFVFSEFHGEVTIQND